MKNAGSNSEKTLSEIQAILIEDWKQILCLPVVGVYDQFFDLGGDSLAAMRCISRIRAHFGVDLPLDEFFLDESSIAALSSTIDRESRKKI